MSAKAAISDQELAAILGLRDAGRDGVDLSSNRVIDLIASGLLTDPQFEALASHPIVARRPVARRYSREATFRRLRVDGLSPELMKTILASADPVLQQAILPLANRDQLDSLRTGGCNTAVRNHAAQLLRRRAR